MPYREFLLRELHPDVGPGEADRAYSSYLADFWGSAARADFERAREDPAVRDRFDPREAAARKVVRDAAAVSAAAEWLRRLDAEGAAWVSPAAVEDGGEDGDGKAGGDDGDDGAAAPMDADAPASREDTPGGSAPPDGARPPGPSPRSAPRARRPPGAPPLAPPLAWAPDRVVADLKRARTIIATADLEKGVTGSLGEGVANPLAGGALPAPSALEAARAVAGGGTPPPLPPADAAPIPTDPAAALAALDAALAYLWEVHRVDFYGGREDWANPVPLPGSAAAAEADAAAVRAAVAAAAAAAAEGDRRGGPPPPGRPRPGIRRTLRPPRTAAEATLAALAAEGGASAPAAETNGDAPAAPSPPASASARAAAERWRDAYRRRIDGHWHGRLKHGDPLANRAQAAAVEAGLAAWVESQVIKHGDTRWGNRLSSKLFVGREFVVKHVRTKHPAALEAARAKVCEDLFFEAWSKAREAEGPPPGWGGGGGGGPGGMPPPPYGMGPGGAMGPMRGGGPYGGGPGGPRGGGGRGGGGGMGMIMMGRGPPGPRGGPPGGGRGGGRGYHDLDDPRNNRAVLDYGDL